MEKTSTDSPLSKALMARLDSKARAALESDAELESWLSSAVENGAQTWPGLRPGPAWYIEHLAARIDALENPRSFHSLKTADLYLAGACAARDPRAIAYFEERYWPLAQRALLRMKIPPSVADDVQSALREQLFFAPAGRRPMIDGYSGRGDLAAWTRSVVVHAALKVRRAQDRDTDLERAEELEAPLDPELAYVKRTYAREFNSAFAEAMASLSDRERILLRQRYVDGLNIDALGTLYGVHRSTVARWVSAACESLRVHVRQTLEKKLRLRGAEWESVVRAIQSSMDVAISQVLQAPQAPSHGA